MKRTLLLIAAVTTYHFVVAQTQLNSGVILPNNNKGTLLLPSATASATNTIAENKTITAQPLPKGTYFTPKGAILILPNRNARNTRGVAQQNNITPANNGLLSDNSGLGLLTDAPLTNINNALTNTTPANNNSFLPPLNLSSLNNTPAVATNNNTLVTQNLQPLTTLTTPVNNAANTAVQTANAATNYYQQLPPLTSLPTINYSAPAGNVISGAYTTSKFNNAASNIISSTNNNIPNNSTIMPPLASIGTVIPQTNQQQYTMPPLASIITNNIGSTKQQNTGMPALAPIEGQGIANNNQNGMPALAPIEGGMNNNTNGSNIPELAPIKSTNLKGFALPKGTILNSKTGTSYTVKPLPATEANKTEEEQEYKPGAGGGMGIPALAPIEEEAVAPKETMPALAEIEKTVEKKEEMIPALAPIEEEVQPVAYQGKNMQQPQQKVVYQSAAPTAKNPCIHIDGSYCPCCVQKPVAKKWTPKKKWTARKTYRKPANIIYIHQPPIVTQQPVNTTQRVVYVPSQPKAKPQIQQPVQQPVKQQEKVVYTDYTKVYYKEPEKPNCNCNQTSTGNAANNPQKYYNPSKYVGVSAGPTSGDYPVTNTTATNEPLRYKFYLNQRGKYSVEVYNAAFSAFLQQDGGLKEYRLNGDANAERPKLNYFGKPESLAGTPITYNYNRKVNQIGGLKFDYDFEGFIKSINGTPILYNSRSSLSSVNGIRVQYDGNGNVTGVDSNDGTVQYTGN